MSRLSRLESIRLIYFWSLLSLLTACNARPILPATGQSGNDDQSNVYQDSFVPGQTGNWLFEQDDSASTGIANEQLVITITAPDIIQYVTLGDQTFNYFALEVDTWQRSGPVQSSYGVLFRVAGDQFYRFDITGNGMYIVERHEADGKWTRLVPDWTPTPAINQGLNVANRLKIIASGDNLTFYVNDILLVQVIDPVLDDGTIALDAGSFGGGDLQVSFDNLLITRGTQ